MYFGHQKSAANALGPLYYYFHDSWLGKVLMEIYKHLFWEFFRFDVQNDETPFFSMLIGNSNNTKSVARNDEDSLENPNNSEHK